VEKLTWRLMPYTVADGPTNMAADEALLKTASGNVATLRFYGWSAPTVSLGYFQKESVHHDEPLLAALPVVRRPSGGAMLVHHHELTYALVVPAESRQRYDLWPRRMHEVIVAALAALGIEARLFEPADPKTFDGPLCFHHFTPGDVLVGSAKVVGSAQRRHRGALLQHGGILLGQSPYAPSLPGIRELTGRTVTPQCLQDAVVQNFVAGLGISMQDGDLSTQQQAIRRLADTKYRTPEWNGRR
jgi:lipoyl(octanoyl) transferase